VFSRVQDHVIAAARAKVERLAPLAVDLVDASGVPPEMLRSPDLVGEPG